MIAIWGGGSAGIRYKTLIEELGYKTILLSRDKNLNSLILTLLIYPKSKLRLSVPQQFFILSNQNYF